MAPPGGLLLGMRGTLNGSGLGNGSWWAFSVRSGEESVWVARLKKFCQRPIQAAKAAGSTVHEPLPHV